jgi:hypothetical protein
MAPADCASVPPVAENASGFRKASIRPICGSASTGFRFGSKRSTVSFSIEWPKRYTTWANSSTIAGSIVES